MNGLLPEDILAIARGAMARDRMRCGLPPLRPRVSLRLLPAAPALGPEPLAEPLAEPAETPPRAPKRLQGTRIAVRDLLRRDLAAGRLAYPPEEDEPRPRTRADCENGPRPCPWSGCRMHLGLEVSPKSGSLRFPFGDRDLEDLPATCALDVAAEGPHTLEALAPLLGLTRERVRQLEKSAKAKLRLALLDDEGQKK